jgi:hypothetical protein
VRFSFLKYYSKGVSIRVTVNAHGERFQQLFWICCTHPNKDVKTATEDKFPISSGTNFPMDRESV